MLHSNQGRNRIPYQKLVMLHKCIYRDKVSKYFLFPNIQLSVILDKYLGNEKAKCSSFSVNFQVSLSGDCHCLTCGFTCQIYGV